MSRKPTYAYLFASEADASEFLKCANKHCNSSFAQHPQKNGVPDSKRVLVTGSGSTIFDLILKEYLDQKADELDGVYQPRV